MFDECGMLEDKKCIQNFSCKTYGSRQLVIPKRGCKYNNLTGVQLVMCDGVN
jgi:hypothetical protein